MVWIVWYENKFVALFISTLSPVLSLTHHVLWTLWLFVFTKLLDLRYTSIQTNVQLSQSTRMRRLTSSCSQGANPTLIDCWLAALSLETASYPFKQAHQIHLIHNHTIKKNSQYLVIVCYVKHEVIQIKEHVWKG